MKFRQVAECFGRIEATSLRNEKTAILAELFKSLTSIEVARVSYLSVGRLGPLYDPIEFGLAEKMVVRALARGTGKTSEEVIKQYKAVGDLGKVAETLVTPEGTEWEVSAVYEELLKIAQDTGKGSQERKIEKLGKLLREMRPLSAKYVVRLVTGKLRLGFSDLTILDALSWAVTGGKEDREELERSYNVWSDMGEVARVYKERGVGGLKKLDVVPGRPVKPMRAERLGTVKEIVEKLAKLAVEPKFDGMRVQIHVYRSQERKEEKKVQEELFVKEQDAVEVRIFSRGLEDITAMFPDVVSAVRKLHAQAGDLVIDGEAVGIDPKSGKYLPFQETMKRKRKHDVVGKTNEIPIQIQVFDVLYTEGKGRLQETYSKRRELLSQLRLTGIFRMAESTVVSTEKEIQTLFDRYMKEKLEGIICKRPDSRYQAGARNFNWVKYKRAHEAGLVDTIDCVVMGYYVGRGKRQKFGLGAFLVGVMGKDEQIVTAAKIGTGLTDEQFREMHRRLVKAEISEKPREYAVPKPLSPDKWVAPEIVVEIQADEVTKSPVHSAGYALRFPRLKQFRDDKKLADITTAEEIKGMFGFTK